MLLNDANQLSHNVARNSIAPNLKIFVFVLKESYSFTRKIGTKNGYIKRNSIAF